MSVDLLTLLAQDYRSITLADIPFKIGLPTGIRVFLLFCEESVRIQIDVAEESHKFVVFNREKYTAKGAISFLALLQSGFFSYAQLKRFVELCEAADLLSLIGQLLPRFHLRLSTEELEEFSAFLPGSGREALHCELLRSDSFAYAVLENGHYDRLSGPMMNHIVKYHIFQEKSRCAELLQEICARADEFKQGEGVLLFCLFNIPDIEPFGRPLGAILDQQIDSSAPFKHSRLLIEFIKYNVKNLSSHFIDAVFQHIFRARDAYIIFNKFISLGFDDVQKVKYVNAFILQMKYPCDDEVQKGILFKTSFQYAETQILSQEFLNDELKSWVEFKQCIVEDRKLEEREIEQLGHIPDLYFIICLAKLKGGKYIGNIGAILRSMHKQFTFFVNDDAVFSYLKFNYDSFEDDEPIIEFPQVDKPTLAIILYLVRPETELAGYELTVCEAAAELLAAIKTGDCSGKLFDVSESQLYLCEITYAVALLTTDYRYVAKAAQAMRFSEQTLSLIASFEKEFVIVLFEMEKLLNFICSFKFGHSNYKDTFSYQYFETKLNETNVEIIYACYMNCYRVSLFYYFLLCVLDKSVKRRYFNQVFEHAQLATLITGDRSCLKLLLVDDVDGYSIIASNTLGEEICLPEDAEHLYRLLEAREFASQECLEITRFVHNSVASRIENMNAQLYFVQRMLYLIDQKEAFAVEQVLFHSSNVYIDNFINREYIIDFIMLCELVQMEFEHITGISPRIKELVRVVIAAAEARGCFISVQDLQLETQDSTLIESEFVQYISDYLLCSKQYPTHNLVSLSLISNYISKMDTSERNRVISLASEQQLRKYINPRVVYSERAKLDLPQQNYYYSILEKFLEQNAKSTFCQPVYVIFQMIEKHFMIDVQLALAAAIYLLAKLYADQQHRNSVSDLIYTEVMEIIDNSDDNSELRAQELFTLISNSGINIFDVVFHNSTVQEKECVKFSTNIDGYRFTDYSVLVKLIEFLRKAKRVNNAYFYVIYALQHEKIQEWLVKTNSANQQRIVAQMLAYSENSGEFRKEIVRIDRKCEIADPLHELRQSINDYYFGQTVDLSEFSNDEAFEFLVKRVKFNNVPFKELENPLSRNALTESLISQRLYRSQNCTPDQQYYSLLCDQIDTNSSFSPGLTEEQLSSIHANIRIVIEASNARKTVLNKIIQLYFKARANLARDTLAILLIVQMHNIILSIFAKSEELVEAYYKIFFVIWLQGCYIFREEECNSVEHKLLHLYLTHQAIPLETQGALANMLRENSALVESIILKMQPYYLLNQLVYIFDGYEYLLNTKNPKQVVFLLRIILVTLQHYAHFDLIMRKMSTYYENDKFCCDLKPVVRDQLAMLFSQIGRSEEYIRVFSKYKSYSMEYTRTILAMREMSSGRRTETIRTMFYYPSFAFIKASLSVMSVDEYEPTIARFEVFNYRFEKQYQSKAKPQLYLLHTGMGQRRLILKGEDETLIDNCIMDYLDSINSMLSFTEYRFRTYYIGQIYKRPSEKGYNIIEVLDNVIPLSDFIGEFPKSAFPKDNVQGYMEKKAFYEDIEEQQLLKFTMCAKNSAMLSLEQHFLTVDSIACWHVIEFVLAIADRHCDNILVDDKQKTVHNIDFEACFFFGKELPFPDVVDLRFSPIILHLLGPAGTQSRYKEMAEDMLSLINETEYLYLNCFMSVGGVLEKQHIVMRLYDRISAGFERYWQTVQKSLDVTNQVLMFEGWKPFDQTFK